MSELFALGQKVFQNAFFCQIWEIPRRGRLRGAGDIAVFPGAVLGTTEPVP